ncbi:hypothetical protein GPROT2_02802 [Gammaproteobacteria bacterium]|nr:hypothetical protein GPROT2_02802 [Gammaproteobacteria bacterium]
MSSRHHDRGMTLIELMVAMAIGLFLTWGAFEVYLQSKGNYKTAEVATRLQENARFALETIEPDLRLAGFWGPSTNTAFAPDATGIAVSCGGNDARAWVLALDRPISASDDGYDIPGCGPHGTARAGSDVLVIRHAGEMLASPDPGQPQVASNLAMARVFDDGVVPADILAGGGETRDLQVHAYYVDNSSSFDAGVPSLRRLTLVKGGIIEDQEMITGVENLQLQFGLDTNGDGSVERYVDPDSPAVTPGAVGYLEDARIVAVRLWMLVRSEESPGPAFSDARSYQPLDLDAPLITPGDADYPAQFQRIEVTKTVLLRNVGAR